MRVRSAYSESWSKIKQEISNSGSKNKEPISRGILLGIANGTTAYLPPHIRLIKTVVEVKRARGLSSWCGENFNLTHKRAHRKLSSFGLEQVEEAKEEI